MYCWWPIVEVKLKLKTKINNRPSYLNIERHQNYNELVGYHHHFLIQYIRNYCFLHIPKFFLVAEKMDLRYDISKIEK